MQGTIRELEGLGLTGNDVHLLDAVPLVAMCWADGELQAEELEELEAFLEDHLTRLNQNAGRPILSQNDVDRFLRRFLHERPPEWLLRRLTALVPSVSLASPDPEQNRRRRQAILGGCLDVGSAAPGLAPVTRRLSAAEKAWYAEIAATLEDKS